MSHPAESIRTSADFKGPRSADPASADGARIVADAVCTACGCLCDDIDLTTSADSNFGRTTIVAAARACTLGKRWFFETATRDDGPVCTIDGRPATLAEGIDRAARLLLAAGYPLIYGLSQTTCEAQRIAVGMGDRLGAVVDVAGASRRTLLGATFHGVGEATCTLGEVRNRGDLLVYWGADPAEDQPRHFTKHALTPVGRFLPGGRRDRYVVLVDTRRTRTADVCDEFIRIRDDAHFEALWTLRALAAGVDLDAAAVERDVGVPLPVWQALVERMKRAVYGALLYDDRLSAADGGPLAVEGLSALTRDLNAYARFVSVGLGSAGNGAGASNVLTWQTGFAYGVNFARGYPRSNASEFTAERVLARREADVVLAVGAGNVGELGDAARRHWNTITKIVVGADPADASSATVRFRTAPYGLAAPGTVHRADGVALALRPARAATRPDDLEVLSRLERRIAELQVAYGNRRSS